MIPPHTSFLAPREHLLLLLLLGLLIVSPVPAIQSSSHRHSSRSVSLFCTTVHPIPLLQWSFPVTHRLTHFFFYHSIS